MISQRKQKVARTTTANQCLWRGITGCCFNRPRQTRMDSEYESPRAQKDVYRIERKEENDLDEQALWDS